ncbi:hypothetical protein D840_01943 [Enterococcus faecalis 20.SD.W.06]|nr:hypothetical protein D840_01943 [Enterococcus faecalis 20.SD.W.06]
MIIEAVMYGETPIEKIEKFCMALPLTIFNIFKKGKLLKSDNPFAFTPGTVMCAPRRNTNKIKTVNKIFDLMSLTLKAFFNSLNN